LDRITNFAIVEITPIGIQNIGWRFWIVWTVLNAVFLPIIYFFYPETGLFPPSPASPYTAHIFPGYAYVGHLCTNNPKANRTLEDVDAYYRSNPPLIVVGDPDAISTKRPLKFIQREDEEVQKRAKEAAAGYKVDAASVEHIN
jgi:hypothetical protein